MNFLRVTWLTIKDSLQSKVFLGIFKYIALKTCTGINLEFLEREFFSQIQIQDSTKSVSEKNPVVNVGQVFHLFCSSIHEKWHPSLCCCCLCLFRVLDENFCNFEMRQLFFFFLFQQQCKYGKVSFSLGCYFFAIITWGTAQDWRSFCLNYFAAVVERKCIFPIGKRRRDLLITQSNFKRPLALLGWKW